MQKINISTLCSISPEKLKCDFKEDFFNKTKKQSIKSEIESIFQIDKVCEENNKKTYRTILEHCVSCIKREAQQHKHAARYQVTSFVLDNPYYNRQECISYLIEHLSKYFHITYSDPFLYITWEKQI